MAAVSHALQGTSQIDNKHVCAMPRLIAQLAGDDSNDSCNNGGGGGMIQWQLQQGGIEHELDTSQLLAALACALESGGVDAQVAFAASGG